MAKETQRFGVTLPRAMYRRAKKYADQDYGENVSLLIRVALAEFFERHYDENIDPSLDWGGWRERERESTDKEGQYSGMVKAIA